MAANSPIDCASRSESGLAQRLYRELLNSLLVSPTFIPIL